MRTGFFRIKSTKTKAKAKGNVIKQLLLIVTTLCFLISSTAQATTYYFHNDHLGTPQVLTDENQQVVWQGAYDPFGHATEVVSEVEQNLRFPGQYLDRETGLHYNWHRTYNPQTGRYTQSDPIGLGGGVDTYGYAYQNPVRYTDPTGQWVPLLPWIPAMFAAIWGMMEVAATAYDVAETARVFADECSTLDEKWIAGGLLAAGMVLPGGGYSKVGDVAKGGRQTLEQRAAGLVKRNGGKNSVTIKHPNGQVRVDLAGKAHHSKDLGNVRTPHVQNYKNNVIPKGPRQGQVGSITKDGDVLPADANILRMVDRYLRSQGQ